jgi:hypothetical protein
MVAMEATITDAMSPLFDFIAPPARAMQPEFSGYANAVIALENTLVLII